MDSNNRNEIDIYIKRVCRNCNNSNAEEVEAIMLTQIAIFLSDLVSRKKADTLFGTIVVSKDKRPSIILNDFMVNVIEGKIDPIFLLDKFLS